MTNMRQYSACNIYPLDVEVSREGRLASSLLPSINEANNKQLRLPVQQLHYSPPHRSQPPSQHRSKVRRSRNQLQQTVAFNLFRSRAYKKRPNPHIEDYNRKKTSSVSLMKDTGGASNPKNVHTVKRQYLYESSLLLKNEAYSELWKPLQKKAPAEEKVPETIEQLRLEPTVVRSPIASQPSSKEVQPRLKQPPRRYKLRSFQLVERDHIKSMNFIRFVSEEQKTDSPKKATKLPVALEMLRKLQHSTVVQEEESCGPWKTLPDEL